MIREDTFPFAVMTPNRDVLMSMERKYECKISVERPSAFQSDRHP